MTEITIVSAESKDSVRWDAYVENHPDSSPYHMFAWKESVERAYGHRGYYLIAERSKSICGVMPVVHMKLPFMFNQLVALPFCDFGKILADNSEVQEQLIIEVTSIAKRLNCEFIQVRSQEEQAFAEHDAEKDTHDCKVRMLMNLPESSEQLIGGFKSKLRSQIRKAEKNGLTFRLGDGKDIDRFYSVFSRNMLYIGSPVHSVKWFKEIIKCYDKNCHIGLVEMDGKTVGGGIILTVGNKVSIPWASTLRGFNRFSPNMLLYWNLLKFSSDNGFGSFDFGRSSVGSGTYKFKAQWGAHAVKLDWYDIAISGENKKDNGESSSSRETAARLWSKMPLPVANILGPIIRKHISL